MFSGEFNASFGKAVRASIYSNSHSLDWVKDERREKTRSKEEFPEGVALSYQNFFLIGGGFCMLDEEKK